MKNTLRFLKKITPMLALAAIIMAPNWGWGQVNIIPTRTDVEGFPSWTDVDVAGSVYLQLLKQTSSCTTPAMNFDSYTGETLNFKARTFGGTNPVENTVFVAISIDNGSNFTDIGSRTPTTSGLVAMVPFDLRDYSGTQVKVKFYVKGTSNSIGVGIDDIAFTGIFSGVTPLITLAPTSLSGFTYVQGNGPSAEQSFTVAGSNLTGDITLTPPTNYEISTGTGGAFSAANPITLSPTSGNVASTPIYVRLKAGLGVGNYNGELITASSAGATNQTVSCSGTVTAPPDPEPTNHVTNFGVGTGSPAYSTIDVIWDDATGGVVPTAYLIKGSSVSYGDIAVPQDGTPEADAALVKNIVAGIETASFTGLTENTTYYFKIFPYTNSGTTIDYKTDGTVPQDVATTETAPPVPAIYFSEYIEGSSNNKALEILNNTGSAIDLGLLIVNTYSNGATTVSYTHTGSGNLNPGATYIIANPTANSAILNIADVTSTVTYYNGDDAVELIYNGQTVDIIGVIGNDPGTAWDVAGISNATANHTLIRKLNVTTGNTNWATSAGTDVNDSEWVVKDQDYFGNLTFVGTVWQGTTTAWADEVNWDMGVPSTYQAWVVPATETPVVSTTETVSDVIVLGNNLHISPTGFLTVENLLGILEPGVVTVEPLGQLSGEIYNFGNEASLIVQSDETGTGSIIPSVSGNKATIQRYLTGAAEAWHLLSSPVAAQNISGDFTPSGTYGDGTGYDFYAWDEPSETWLNQKVAANNLTAFAPAKGYLVAYQATNPTKTFTGIINEGIYFTPLTVSGTQSYQHSNLIGNPYPSSIDWKLNSGYDKSKLVLDGGGYNMYIWNDAVNNYGVYNDANSGDNGTNNVSRYIPPMQGFFVIASTAGEFGFDNDARVHNTQSWLKSGNDNALRLSVTAPANAGKDEVMLDFGHESSQGGADKWFSMSADAPALYVPTPERDYSIRFLTNIVDNPIIPVAFKAGVDGEYSIQANFSTASFSSIKLIDQLLGTAHELSNGSPYNFTASTDDDANRFALAFGSLGIDKPTDNEGVQVFAYGGMLYVQTSSVEPAVVNVYNLTGQLVMQSRTGSATLSTFNASALGRGVYVVNVIFKDKVVSRKVVNQY